MTAKREPNVGQRIRALREKQRLSLRALAERCGLSINAISRIERGENSPTVSSLHQLATALGVAITDFFEDESNQPAILVRADSRLITRHKGMVIESLGIGLRQQRVQPFLILLEPGAGTMNDPISHPGEEFVFCLEGTLDFRVGDYHFTLSSGDSLVFEASQPHGFQNSGNDPASMLVTFNADRNIQPTHQSQVTSAESA